MISDASGRYMVFCCLKKDLPESSLPSGAGDRGRFSTELKLRFRTEVLPACLLEVGEITERVVWGACEPVPQLEQNGMVV